MSESQLRIALLSVHSSPLGQPGIGDTGGMSIYIRELTREIVKLGYVVDIFTRVKDRVTPEIIDLFPGARQIHIQAGDEADIDKLLIYSHIPDFACRTATYCKQHNLNYDIVFSHYWLSGIAGYYLQTWWQIPHTVMFHTLGAVKNAIGIGEDEPDLRLDEERQVMQHCDRIIASTERERYALNRYYGVSPEKVSVIPCGVNLDLFRPTGKAMARRKLGLGEDKIMLFVGRIERLKGIDKIIRAMNYLADIRPKLIIVGEDGNRPGEINYLKELAQSLGVLKDISFTGLINYENLPDFYSAADVCVFPSYYESFGLAPLESLACGTPVVATDVGDLKNIILQGSGYVLKDNRFEDLADKIGLILRNPEPGPKEIQSIRSTVLHFGWQHIARLISIEFGGLIVNNTVMSW